MNVDARPDRGLKLVRDNATHSECGDDNDRDDGADDAKESTPRAGLLEATVTSNTGNG